MPKPDISPPIALALNIGADKSDPESGTLLKKNAKKMVSIRDNGMSRVEKYEELDKNHPLNKPFTGNPSFRGPVFARKITNLIFVFIFLIFNILFAVYGLSAYKDGAAGRLTRGNDFRAEICGTGKLESRKYLYYLDPSKDLKVRQCMESCPTTSGQQLCLYDVDPTVNTTFCYQQLSTVTYGRFCLPTEPINKQIVDTELSQLPNYIRRIAGDLGASMDMIVVGLILSLIFGAIFLRFLFKSNNIKYVIWGSIWGTITVFLCMAYFFYREYRMTIDTRCILKVDKRGCGGFKAYMFKYACYGFIGLAFLYLLVIMKLFNRINLGIGLLKSTTACSAIINQMKFLPWVLSLVMGLIAGFFFIGTIWGFSVGEIVTVETENIDGGLSKIIEYNLLMRYLIGFNFFMLQWWSNVILLVSDCVVSYAVSIWFFEKRKETVILPISRIFKDVMKFHIGTIIMLALYKIIFRPSRMILGLFNTIMRKPKQSRNLVRFMQACCLCCIHAYERSLRYQSKHAIVQMIMWSESFRISSKRAWFLLFRHKSRITSMDNLVAFILMTSKLACCLFGGLFVYAFLSLVPRTITGTNTSEVETPLGPTLLVFYIGFFYSSIFMSVLDMAYKTVLQCYLMDYEMFVGEQRFAEKRVLEFMEFFKDGADHEDKFGKMAQYVTGIKQTYDPNLQIPKDEDPDEDENRKFELKIPKDSDESEEEEEEDDEQKKALENKEKEKKDGEDDEEEEEDDDSEEEEDDSEEEGEDEEAKPVFKNVFGPPIVGKSIEFENKERPNPLLKSLQMSQVHVRTMNTSQNHSQLSLLGNSGLSFFGKEHERSREGNSTHNVHQFGSKREESKQNKREEEEEKKKHEEEEEESEYEEEEESEEEESGEEPEITKHDASTKLFGGWGNAKGKEHAQWKPLEMSALSRDASAYTNKGLLMLGDGTNLHITDVTSNNTRIIEKTNKTNNTMRSDTHNIFNKSKIADNTTIRLEYDDEEEGTTKYRL